MKLTLFFLAVLVALAGCSSSKTIKRERECGCKEGDNQNYSFMAEPRSSGDNLARVSTELHNVLKDLQEQGNIYGLCTHGIADGKSAEDTFFTFVFCGEGEVEDKILLSLGEGKIDIDKTENK